MGLKLRTIPWKHNVRTCRNRTIMGLKRPRLQQKQPQSLRRNRTIMGLKPCNSAITRFRSMSRNRTIMGLKRLYIAPNVELIVESQSNHYGIETAHNLSLDVLYEIVAIEPLWDWNRSPS